MPDDRTQALRELEIEYRWLAVVEQEARMARVGWIEKLAHDLRINLREFWTRIEAGEQ